MKAEELFWKVVYALKSVKVIMMMINYFCVMVDRQKTLSLISSWDHSERFSPLQISDTLRAKFDPAQNLDSDFIKWSCTVVITTAPRLQFIHQIWKQVLERKLVYNLKISWLATLWANLHNCNLLHHRNETPPKTFLRLFSKANHNVVNGLQV